MIEFFLVQFSTYIFLSRWYKYVCHFETMEVDADSGGQTQAEVNGEIGVIPNSSDRHAAFEQAEEEQRKKSSSSSEITIDVDGRRFQIDYEIVAAHCPYVRHLMFLEKKK